MLEEPIVISPVAVVTVTVPPVFTAPAKVVAPVEKLVNIIVNCYNGEKYLKKNLESIQKQKYSNWELIFWDNQSSDNSKKIFDSFKDKRFKYYCSDKHTTLYEARNLACKKTNGEFIAFLDCDDWWYENFLSSRTSFSTNGCSGDKTM
mgnify:CR=1 FL=1